ncbi:hypothetical protein GBAR_LOCUS31437 [Geodia barretti]|uniref:Uncharacterized protein n=1 Tax=Geodia barretti TaxID=519541 RepID=A0AA35U1L5_GEOBA|nr:hypothetical protein GBAR_LOCUS31437 [Geodia barretti]
MWNYNAGFLSLWMLNGVLIAGEEVAEALFSQSFSIGHRYPNPSSLWSSSSSPLSSFSSLTPLNTPASTTQQQPSFPGTGHQLGHGSSSLDYSSPAEPPSLSSSSSAASFSAQGSAGYPQHPSPSSPPSVSDSKTVYTGPSSSSDSKRQTSSLGVHPGSSLPAGPCPPPDAKLSVFSSTSSCRSLLPVEASHFTALGNL